MSKYLVISEEEVFFNFDMRFKCRDFIRKTLKKYPNHRSMKIYKEVTL